MTEIIDKYAVWLVAYIVIMNVIAFVVYGIDKSKARRKRWRIPEHTLIFLAFIGGSVGALLGMYFFHHKTKHPKFYIGIPAILAFHIAIVAAYQILN